MSSDNDLSDELLALAGDSEDQPRRRKRTSSSQHKASKRRKQEPKEDYGDDLESEEDESNPYPLEGKYADELDRQRLLDMPETEREEILSQRMEEMQRFQDKVNLDRLLKAQKGSPDASSDPVAKAAKRKHTNIGATKEKTMGLEQLREKRKAKLDNVSRKARAADDSPVKRRSSTPSSDSSDEEGQFRPGDESFENNSTPRQKKEEKEEPPTIADFHKARLTREQLAKFCHVGWFQELVQGAYVRYLTGSDETGAPIYRVCEVIDLGADLVKPYNFENQVTDQVLELRHGKDTKLFPMDKVSNAPFTDREVDRLIRMCEVGGVKLPTKSRLEKKAQRLQQLTSQRFTDTDINKMMERKAALQQRPSHAQLLQEKSRLNQARNLARSRRDVAEVAELDAKIAKLEAVVGETRTQEEDRWAKVNERNRRLNLEQTKRAEALALAKRKAIIAARVSTPKLGTPKPGTPMPGTPGARTETPPNAPSDATPPPTFDAMVQAVSIDIDF